MSLSSNYNSGSEGPDFHLPDEILSVIPTNPYDQLDIARKITSMAITSRVSTLESETIWMRDKIQEKDGIIRRLEEKITQLERAFVESETRLKDALDQNEKLVEERDSLSASSRKLNRDLLKMETFKRQLMQSLKEDDPAPAAAEEIGAENHEGRPCGREGNSDGYVPAKCSASSGNILGGGGITPKIISIIPAAAATAVETPPKDRVPLSGTTSPHPDAISSWSSRQSSAASSPPRSRIDGKEFFRLARSRLSYEQFSAFLTNIKEFNAQKQSRQETLKRAEQIFGITNKDLYASFHRLLYRPSH